MFKPVGDVRIGDTIVTENDGQFTVSRYRWYAGLGVIFFDQDGQEAGRFPFNQEIEVI